MRKNKEIRFEKGLWDKYNPMFGKMEAVLRSCNSLQQLEHATDWIRHLVVKLSDYEPKLHSGWKRTVAFDFIWKERDVLDEITNEKYEKLYKEYMDNLGKPKKSKGKKGDK